MNKNIGYFFVLVLIFGSLFLPQYSIAEQDSTPEFI